MEQYDESSNHSCGRSCDVSAWLGAVPSYSNANLGVSVNGVL